MVGPSGDVARDCSMAKVSVVVPAYNYANYLPEAIQSVLHQTFDDFELLIVDDGSTDNTRRATQPFLRDHRMKYLYQENRGLAATRNRGVKSTDGELVAFLDADDVWLEQKLEKQVAIMDSEPDVGLVYTDIHFINDQGRILTDRQWAQRRKETMFEDLLFNNVVTGSASSSMVRRECFHSVGLFDESLKSLEDLDLWLRIARHYRLERVDERLTKIRHHQLNMQVDVDRMAEGWMAHLANREVPPQYRAADRLARYEILTRIARQYYELSRMKKYRQYALKAVGNRRRHIVNPSFWKEFLSSYLGRTASTHESWVTRSLKN
jgi:glycosyltransferase involved in cell wall biosynthesis